MLFALLAGLLAVVLEMTWKCVWGTLFPGKFGHLKRSFDFLDKKVHKKSWEICENATMFKYFISSPGLFIMFHMHHVRKSFAYEQDELCFILYKHETTLD